MMPKKRGRPFKKETLESKAFMENFQRRPEWAKLPSKGQESGLSELIASMDRTEKEIISQYKYSHTTSAQHAYNMASIGDEAMSGREKKFLLRDQEKSGESAKNKKAGGAAVKESAATRAIQLCRINKVLLERLKPLGPLSMSDVAQKILRDWKHLDPAALLPGEPKTLKCRGLPGEPPTSRTIANYITSASPFKQHRVGKTSLRNK